MWNIGKDSSRGKVKKRGKYNLSNCKDAFEFKFLVITVQEKEKEKEREFFFYFRIYSFYKGKIYNLLLWKEGQTITDLTFLLANGQGREEKRRGGQVIGLMMGQMHMTIIIIAFHRVKMIAFFSCCLQLLEWTWRKADIGTQPTVMK